MSRLTLSYSLADQTFERTKSLGILNLSVQLCQHLARSDAFQQLSVFSNRFLSDRLVVPPGVRIEEFDSAANSRLGRMMWDQWRCYSAAARAGHQWLFLPKGFASFTRSPPVKLAAYVHDAMHDFYSRQFPRAIPRFERWYFRQSLIATLRRADVIFTNTEFTRSEVLRLARQYRLPAPRVIAAGIGFSDVSELPGAKSNRIVALVGRPPHKRSELAVEWIARWQKDRSYDGEVHLIGSLPSAVQAPPTWRVHPRLTDAQYEELLRSARVVVYFSDYEGFGMPPVEAILRGACAVFSDLPAMREVMPQIGFAFSNTAFETFRRAMDGSMSAVSEAIAGWRRKLLKQHAWDVVIQRIVGGLAG